MTFLSFYRKEVLTLFFWRLAILNMDSAWKIAMRMGQQDLYPFSQTFIAEWKTHLIFLPLVLSHRGHSSISRSCQTPFLFFHCPILPKKYMYSSLGFSISQIRLMNTALMQAK